MKNLWNTHNGNTFSKKILHTSVVCLILLLSLSLVYFKPLTSASANLNSNAQPFQTFNNINNNDWYKGTNQSTPLADVNYSEFMPQNDTLDRCMTLTYPDSTSALSMHLIYFFNPGGINDSASSYPNYNPQVLDWSQLNGISLRIAENGNYNGLGWGSSYEFTGFDIVNGTAQQLSLSRVGNSTDYAYMLNNIVGSIWYANCSAAEISPVTLTTENTTYNGKAVTDSLATFNLTLDAQIINTQLVAPGPSGTELPPHQTLSDVPVVLTFGVTENSAYTAYKYGVYVDWSEDNAFPTTGLNNGDNFTLVSFDRLGFETSQSPTSPVQNVFFFSTDSQNDSAVYSVNGTVLCQEFFPLNYTINGNSQTYNTTRIYVPYQNYVQSTNSSEEGNSAMFVGFGGFYYNQSSGFSFDPTVITYNSVSGSSPSPTPTNNPTPTPSPTSSTSSPSAAPTATPEHSSAASNSKSGTSPSPTAPEFPSSLAVITIFVAASTSIAVLKTSKKNKKSKLVTRPDLHSRGRQFQSHGLLQTH